MSARPQTPPPLSSVPAVGELVNGKYRVEGMAGVGGMGIVLSARHEELGHRVAIKVLASDEETTSAAVERFLREGRVVASLQSDHVVRIYDVGRLDSGVPFMVMELLRGHDLSTYISTSGAIGAEQAVDWILQAISAIVEAHEHGIVHRDLKPANLFLTQRSDGSDCVKVLDFGISKRIAVQDPAQYKGDLTATRQVVGSPAYMSPEQVRNARDIDHRVDIWALGMTLYELLTGHTAFEAETFPAVCAAIVTDTPPPLRAFVPEIPQGLQQIVLRCLEKDPNKRFASVTALANALRPFGSPNAASTGRALLPGSGTLEVSQSGADSSTLISSQTPSGRRSIASSNATSGDGIKPDRTLNSVGLEAEPRAGRSVVSLPKHVVRRFAWLLLALGGFMTGAIWKLRATRLRTQEISIKAAGSSGQVEDKGRFSIVFDSVPSGAEVWDGSVLLGSTPFTFSVERFSVKSSPRKFVFQKVGFEPFVAFQSDTVHDSLITARLTASAVVVSTTAPSPSTLQKKTTRIGVPSKPESAGTVGAPSTGAQIAPSDIRPQR